METTLVDQASSGEPAGARRKKRGARWLASTLATALVASGMALGIAMPASAAQTGEIDSVTGSWNVIDRWTNYVLYTPGGRPPFPLSAASSITPSLPDTCVLPDSIPDLDAVLPPECLVPLASGASGDLNSTTGDVTGVKLGSIEWINGHFPSGVKISDLTYNYSASSETATVTADFSGQAGAVVPGDDVLLATFSHVEVGGNGSAIGFINSGGIISPGITANVPSWSPYAGEAAAPLTVTLNLASPAVSAGVVSSTPAGGLVVSVSGSGFEKSSPGIYVSLNPSDSLSTSFGTAWISNDEGDLGSGATDAQGVIGDDGHFTATLTIPADQLNADKSYVIYTRKAHGQAAANPSQTTQTPIAIDFASLVWKSSTTSLAVAGSAVFGKAVTATATVSNGATGQVEFFDGSKSLGKVAVVSGKATKSISGLAAGKHSISAKYLGSTTHVASAAAAKTVNISKAKTSKVTVTGKKFKKNTKPTVTIKVAKLNNGNYAVGTVAVYVGGKKVKTVKLTASKKGTIKVKLSKKYKKSIKVKAKFTPTDTKNIASKTSVTKKITVKK